MPQDNSNLPEGTDKVIAGASTTAAGPGGTSGDRDSLIASGDAAAPDARRGLGQQSPAAGSEAGGDEAVVTATTTTIVTERELSPTGGTERTGSGSGNTDSGIAARLRSGSEKLSGQAADKARGLLSQGLERSSEALANVSKLVGETATGLDERLGPEYGDYARRAATAIEDTANSIAAKDPEELIDDTRNFVRRSPAVALAGAAIVGFAVARLIKTGLAGDEEGSGRQRSKRSSDS